MSSKNLKNKPLVEAILEVKWALQSPVSNLQLDPHYKLLLGRLYDRVSGEYPEHEQLPTATVPDEIAGYMVQHRFRHAANEWPLLQIGPGILTLNDTQKYIWDDFRTRSLSAVDELFASHPKPSELKIESLLLRYIDAVEFDYTTEDVCIFLKEKMRVSVLLPETLFMNNSVRTLPRHLNWQVSFECERPKGLVTVRFATGMKDEKPVLLWETMVQSSSGNLPVMPTEFSTWISAAHDITDDWFFKLIEGELERRFSGE
jgi:uncharacterized protein (TIGR04255 family)